MSAQKPNTNKVIDYWLSWADYSNNRDKLAEYKNGSGSKKQRVDVINIAFALPQENGTLTWTDAGTADNYQKTKDIIKELRAQGKDVLISVGGQNAPGWNLSTPKAINELAQNIKKFVEEYGLNGVDIDYEKKDPVERAKVADLIVALRDIMPKNQYVLSYAAWSIGAYGKGNPGHEHPEWAGSENSGIDVDVLKKAGDRLDYVNVMSYDAFDPNMKEKPYDPIQALEAYKKLMNDNANKVVLGLELGLQWPNVRKSTEDVKPWIEYAIKNGFAGVMCWALEYDFIKNTQYEAARQTKEPDGAFIDLITGLMPKVGIGYGAGVAEAGLDTSMLKDNAAAAVGAGMGAAGAGATPASVSTGTAAGASAGAAAIAGGGAGAAAAKPISEAPDTKQQKEKEGVKPPPPPLHTHYNAGKQQVDPQKEEIIKKLAITDLPETSQDEILKIYQRNVSTLANLKQHFSTMQAQRNKQLETINPAQIAAVKQQYEAQNKLDADYLNNVEKDLNHQLNHFIKQHRDVEQQKPRP